MDEISSSEFRKTYAAIRHPVYVTALGRVIGHWIPANSATYAVARVEEGTEVYGLTPPPGADTREPKDGDPIFRFNSRPFTPVPKKR